jgi:uncharacterized protein Yka (UPF0111/DUF47 family)
MLALMAASPPSAGPGRSTAPEPASFAREFALLEEMTRTIEAAAQALVGGLEGREPFSQVWARVRDLEHQGDAVARDLFDALVTPRVGGPAPEAFKALTGLLDDVLDAVEAAAARLALHRIRRVLPAAVSLGRIVLESAGVLRQAVAALGGTQDLFPLTRALHRLENQGDDVLRDAIEALFAGEAHPRDIIKWKDICEILEEGTDRCEDIANVLETFLVQTGGGDHLVAGQVVLDVGRHEVRVGGTPVPLSAKEFGVLHLLLRHQGKVVRRERLLHEVWGGGYFGDARTLDTHIGWLRKKLEARGGVRIVAVRGIGYRLDLTG